MITRFPHDVNIKKINKITIFTTFALLEELLLIGPTDYYLSTIIPPFDVQTILLPIDD